MGYKNFLCYLFLTIFCLSNCQKKEKQSFLPDSDINKISAIVVKKHTPLLITPDASNILTIDSPIIVINKNMKDKKDAYSLKYSFDINEDIDFSTLRFALNKHLSTNIAINGQTIYPIPSSHFLNEDYLLYEIGQYSLRGHNYCIVCPKKEPIVTNQTGYVLGSFSLYPTDKGFKIHQPIPLQIGNWVKQGMPFYHETVTYSKIYTFLNKQSHYFLLLSKWSGSSAEIYINNQSIGEIEKESSKIDISKYITIGENSIDIKISGYPCNVTGPFYLPDSIKQIPLSGYQYEFMPSGLFADFYIEEYKPS